MPLFLPLVSPKAYAKIQYASSLSSLSHTNNVSLASLQLTIPLLEDESAALQGSDTRHTPTGPSSNDSSSRLLDNRALYDLVPPEPQPLARILVDLRDTILSPPCTLTEGLFRRSTNSPLSSGLLSLSLLPSHSQSIIPWRTIAANDPLLPPKILHGLLSSFSSPIISEQLYPVIRKCDTPKDIETYLSPILTASENRILTYLADLISHLARHEETTRMTVKALAICLAPALLHGSDPMIDATMCLVPGQSLPPAMTQDRDLGQGAGTVVGMLMLWAEWSASNRP
ncbi:hypothetical protein BD324DRAFT_636404 [Kockovaella imperatae]|uniref:Rho-GAP domain-containing protein n=1 Tax=Kockovaella imperatae TaxID=4999 RepID=A0A1Y1U971_9TREE|nr:hypothetical protein BD324DRAFT_636404 [Kockovaella imperatae]ORX34562.1 hypothetical protein BD324DRAFT_636404 [Kockovaella imperatae]